MPGPEHFIDDDQAAAFVAGEIHAINEADRQAFLDGATGVLGQEAKAQLVALTEASMESATELNQALAKIVTPTEQDAPVESSVMPANPAAEQPDDTSEFKRLRRPTYVKRNIRGFN